jgi:glycine cleavage system H lipoate-binding protein
VSDQDLRYTAEHEWIAVRDGADGGDAVLRIGITDYAQQAWATSCSSRSRRSAPS